MKTRLALCLLTASLFCQLGMAEEDLSPTLINGRNVDPGEYKEVVRIRSGNSSCSATAVSGRVILTAAHCTNDDGSISQLSQEETYHFTVGHTAFSARCKLHPLYRDNVEDMDIALCKTSSDLGLDGYASVANEEQRPQLEEKVVLIGYGCIREGGGGGNDGILRVGSAKTIQLPKESPVNNWYYVKKSAADQSALCFGDSGGPSFRLESDHDTRDSKSHLIYGVNSRGNIRDLSLLAAVYLPKARNWMQDWADENQVEICGLNKDCMGDNGGEEEPEPEPEPEPEEPKKKCKRLYKKMKKYEKKFKKYERRYEACQASFSRFDFELNDEFSLVPYNLK